MSEINLHNLFKHQDNSLSDRQPRLVGLVFLVISLCLAKWQIYDPLTAASQGRGKVWTWDMLIILAIALGPYGILLLIFGNKPNQWFKIDPENLTTKNIFYLSAWAIVSGVVFIYIKRELAFASLR